MNTLSGGDSTVPVSFAFNDKKAIEVICWLANEEPGIDIYTVVKAEYFADKMHLQEYGRPVVGDRYYALEHGMVPSIIYDGLKNGGQYHEGLAGALDGAVERRREDYPRFYPQRHPDEEYLSGSDIQCLRSALAKCRGLSFDELKRLAHNERAYKEAWDSRPRGSEAAQMDYEAIIDDDVPERDKLIRDLRESARTMVL